MLHPKAAASCGFNAGLNLTIEILLHPFVLDFDLIQLTTIEPTPQPLKSFLTSITNNQVIFSKMMRNLNVVIKSKDSQGIIAVPGTGEMYMIPFLGACALL